MGKVTGSLVFASLIFVSASSMATDYRLAMSKDDVLCKYVAAEYSKAPRSGSYVDHELMPMFNKIDWRPIEKTYLPNWLSSEYAYIDIDNDRVKEFVVRQQGMLQSIYTRLLSIHKKEPDGARKEYTLKMFKGSDGKLLSLPLKYKLNNFNETPEPGSLDARASDKYSTSGMFVSPMVFNDIVYVSLEDSARVKLKKWVVIAKYKGGSLWGRKSDPQSAVLEDICYLEQKK